MKKIKLLFYFALIVSFTSFIGCTKEESLEFIEEPKQIEILQTKNGSSGPDCDTQVVITFTFEPNTPITEKIAFKNQYYLKRLRNMDICQRIAGDLDCPDSEKWIVSNYVDPIQGTGDVNEAGGAREGEPEDYDDGDNSSLKSRNRDCFENGTIIIGGIIRNNFPGETGHSFENEDEDNDGRGNYY